MMASFMRCCKSISLFLVFVFACSFAWAEQSGITIKHADLKADGEEYRLSADLEITLAEEMEEAINKGVALEFVYTFELMRPRTFWFDQEVVKRITRITVSYHALSRQYLVSHNGRQTSHEILSEAMIELVQLYDWTVFKESDIESGEEYEARLGVSLDESKLPKAIQVEAIGSEDWRLVAEPYEWSLKDLK